MRLEQTLARLLQPIRRRISLLITRAVVNASNATGGIQILQVSPGKNETLHDLEHFEPYGYTSNPKDKAEALVVSFAGDRGHSIVLMVNDRRYRLKGLAKGEVALYDDQGQQFILKRDGMEINAPQGLTINGELQLNGGMTSTGDVVADGISLKTHTHGGVQTGGGSTGGPQ